MLGGRLRVIRREISPIGSTPASSAARETRNNLENQLSAWQLVIWSIDKAGSSWESVSQSVSQSVKLNLITQI